MNKNITLIIGSGALNKQLYNKLGILYRPQKDVDCLAYKEGAYLFIREVFNKSQITQKKDKHPFTKIMVKGESSFPIFANSINKFAEIEIVDDNEHSRQLYDIILNDKETIFEEQYGYASLDVIYLLKMSHRFKKNSPHFLKTMRDIHNLRKLGAKIREEHKEFFKIREKLTYNYSHPKLNKSKKDFFNDKIKYIYDHDSIHESVKIDVLPAYQYFKKEGQEVFCDMKKFESLPQRVKLNAVYEESCVLALERSIIPYNTDYKKAFLKSLEKVCTSITSGKFREFAWENYYSVVDMYTPETFDNFFMHLKQGKIDKVKRN